MAGTFDLGTASGRVELDTSDVARAKAEVAGFGQSFGTGMVSAGKKLSSVGRTLTSHVTLPILGIAAAGVKTAVDFEKSMNTMKAVAGVPGPELEKLSDLAVDLGAKTVFSANEAAEGMLELAKAGISTSDIMGGALQNTLDLATAGDLELADAATIAANAMSVFSLNGKESKEAVDALAGAANASSADVSDLAIALSQGGLAAANAGLDIQETTAVLAAFADNGLRGSDAGTSLKTMLLSLVPSTLKAKEAMAELDLSFVNADGSIKNISQIFDEIKNKIGPLTQEQQQLALKTIFGTDAFRAASIAMRLGSDGLEKYTKSTEKVGSASKVAQGKMKGLPGAIEKLKGSFETFLLTVGDELAPVIEDLAEQIGDLLDSFSKLPESTRQNIIKFTLLAAAAGPLLRIFGPMIGLVGRLVIGFGRLGGALAGLSAAGGGAATAGFFSRLAFAIKSVAGGAATTGEALQFLFPFLSKIAGPAALAAIAIHDLAGAFSAFKDDGALGFMTEEIGGWGADLLKQVNPTAGAFVDLLHQIADGFRDVNTSVEPVPDQAFGDIGKISQLNAEMENLNVTLTQNERKLFNSYIANKQFGSAAGVLERAIEDNNKGIKNLTSSHKRMAETTAITAQKQHALAGAHRAAGAEADNAKGKTENYTGALNKVPKSVRTKVDLDSAAAQNAANNIKATLEALERTYHASVAVTQGASGLAKGTRDFVGGLTIVGERGPELAILPKHTAIIPAHITRGIMGLEALEPVKLRESPVVGGGPGALIPARVTVDVDGKVLTKTVEQRSREQRITLGRR